jgi:predicted amidophosphoribosyltransferase
MNMDALGGIALYEVLKSLAEFAADVLAIAFFWWGACVLWRYNGLLKSMRTCERCGREVLNRTASHCGRCGQALQRA